MNGKLYLFPTQLGDTDFNRIIPAYNNTLISEIKYFIVEDIRTARRFLKKCNHDINIDELTFYVLNKHTSPADINSFIEPLKKGQDVGLLSEAGCPAIADPGADVVALAQMLNIRIIPLVGPSSILLALMASGFNGQSFAFNGYLPIQETEKASILKMHEKKIYADNQTQIYIETPYRNMKTISVIIATCLPETKLCVAADITLPTEYINTKSLKNWKNNLPDLTKRPCIFILYK
ncbi:MAG: SAM-dependent methyltransferase [Paludibacter sp.]|nr:SAM-dependent methyltransferase [Paludibacter sp.]MDD4198570.1 SAM-dependent methyltransferase [Paludibacter sp.]MDD4428448.1 SAM-dependent methyltransferase [Paludibacter sp.]